MMSQDILDHFEKEKSPNSKRFEGFLPRAIGLVMICSLQSIHLVDGFTRIVIISISFLFMSFFLASLLYLFLSILTFLVPSLKKKLPFMNQSFDSGLNAINFMLSVSFIWLVYSFISSYF